MPESLGVQSMSTAAKLIFLCGKMAAGKSTLARELAERENAIQFLSSLYLGEITDRCFRNPLLVSGPQLLLAKAFLSRFGPELELIMPNLAVGASVIDCW
jgi:hypothetical protein